MIQSEQRAPAKINLTLHVTGQRADGYHLLESLVVFAPRAADKLALRRSETVSLEVTGPLSEGVPVDRRNLCWKAADLADVPVDIRLEKHLPHAAGIGGGSADAAAVLRGISELEAKPFAGNAARLGADVPVCLASSAQMMRGIGDVLSPASVPPLYGVLVNPRVDVPTSFVFGGLQSKENPPMSPKSDAFSDWLVSQRNDLQPPAIAYAPVISDVLETLECAHECWLARMSGSGATCFGLFETMDAALETEAVIADRHPEWWAIASELV